MRVCRNVNCFFHFFFGFCKFLEIDKDRQRWYYVNLENDSERGAYDGRLQQKRQAQAHFCSFAASPLRRLSSACPAAPRSLPRRGAGVDHCKEHHTRGALCRSQHRRPSLPVVFDYPAVCKARDVLPKLWLHKPCLYGSIRSAVSFLCSVQRSAQGDCAGQLCLLL